MKKAIRIKATTCAMMLAVLLTAAPLTLQAQTGQGQPAPAPTPRTAEQAERDARRRLELVQVTAGGSYLGVSSRDVKAERLAELKLKEERGVEIVEVDQESPAGKAGLRAGDVILEFNGVRVESMQQLRRILSEIPPGRKATLGISRNGQSMTLPVELGERPRSSVQVFRSGPGGRMEFVMPPMPPMAPMPPLPPRAPLAGSHFMAYRSPVHGLVVENLNQQLGEYFGVKNGEGVLVRSVEKGSAAEGAGFRAGDVIIQVQEERIVDFSDFRRALRKQKKGTVPVRIVRDKREQSLSLAIPEGGRDSSWNFDFEMDHLQREIERLRPEIQRLAYSLGETAARELSASSAEIERAVRQATEDFARDMRKRKVELEKEVERLRKEQRRLEQEWEREKRSEDEQ